MPADGAPAGGGKQRDGEEKSELRASLASSLRQRNESTANARDPFPGTGIRHPPISLAAAPVESRACRIDLSSFTALVAHEQRKGRARGCKKEGQGGADSEYETVYLIKRIRYVHENRQRATMQYCTAAKRW
jgi:hypothetical protein